MRSQNAERRTQKLTRARAFTLVELMVAIALVLVLMVGVSKVFKITTDTVSANQGISDNTRNARAAQAVLARDIGANASADAPCMLLFSHPQAAFRNRTDQAADRDGDPLTVDIDGDNLEGEAAVPGEVISHATYNARNHRLDILSFFARDRFARQTGGQMPTGATPFVADMSTSEAWIWYGHLRLYDGQGDPAVDGSYPLPGDTAASNTNNRFATDWILGREQILLREPNGGVILDRSGTNSQVYIQQGATLSQSPLHYNSNTNISGTGSAFLRASRYDVAGTSISSYRQRLDDYIAAQVANDPWWQDIFLTNTMRFQSNPFITKPITPATLSQQFPIFLRGCTSFMVEYAGDFLIQNNDPADANYGAITGVYAPSAGSVGDGDGQIDYYVEGTGIGRRRVIRWYGLPRSVNGDGTIKVNQLGTGTPGNRVRDVVPLRDVWRLAPGENASSGAPFEKFTWNGSITPAVKDFLGLPGDYATAGGLAAADRYICAWKSSDRKPKMIRITLTLDDPAGRTADGQTYEYVFELP